MFSEPVGGSILRWTLWPLAIGLIKPSPITNLAAYEGSSIGSFAATSVTVLGPELPSRRSRLRSTFSAFPVTIWRVPPLGPPLNEVKRVIKADSSHVDLGESIDIQSGSRALFMTLSNRVIGVRRVRTAKNLLVVNIYTLSPDASLWGHLSNETHHIAAHTQIGTRIQSHHEPTSTSHSSRQGKALERA